MTENTIDILRSIISMYELTLCTAVIAFQHARQIQNKNVLKLRKTNVLFYYINIVVISCMCVSLFLIKDKSFFIYVCTRIVYLLGLILLQMGVKGYPNIRLGFTRELCTLVVLVLYLGLMLLTIREGLI